MNRWEFDIEQVKTMTDREYMRTRPGMYVGYVSSGIEELLFESAARNKLGLKYMDKAGIMTIKDYISNFVKTGLPEYLYAHLETTSRRW